MNCKYCGIELINGGCINLCWVMAKEPDPWKSPQQHLITSGSDIMPRCSCGRGFTSLEEALEHQKPPQTN